ncbi:hypothetical protein K8R78_01975 [bacterium]|nr:hypothetical protein [bacterium]
MSAIASPFSFMAADDFELSTNFEINEIELWGIFPFNSPSGDYLVRVYGEASGGGPDNGNVIGQTTVPAASVTNTDTGYTFGGWSSPVYKVGLVIPTGEEFILEVDTRYWVMVQAQAQNSFNWLAQDHDSSHFTPMYYSSTGGNSWDDCETAFGAGEIFDCFFRLIGNESSAIEETSWGMIKATL